MPIVRGANVVKPITLEISGELHDLVVSNTTRKVMSLVADDSMLRVISRAVMLRSVVEFARVNRNIEL